jgi:hypothetical protein
MDLWARRPNSETIQNVVTWRKANQIHNWFVENVQNGNDDCKRHRVTYEKLTTLRDLCATVLETKNGELLPTKSGFFFGSTDYDRLYWQNVERTHKELDLTLGQYDSSCEFYYESSW